MEITDQNGEPSQRKISLLEKFVLEAEEMTA